MALKDSGQRSTYLKTYIRVFFTSRKPSEAKSDQSDVFAAR
jgi:hypothetical protein